MKKNGMYVAMIALALSCGFAACSDNDDPVLTPDVEQPTSSDLNNLVTHLIKTDNLPV